MTADLKQVTTDYPSLSVPTAVRRLVGAHLVVALVALGIGGVFGIFQALNTDGIQLYGVVNRALPAPVQVNYYEGLTVHGVLMALVFTTFFICGFLVFVTARSVGADRLRLRLQWGCWWAMLVGLVLAAFTILTNNATVLYTFYPPLKASPAFYLGLALVVLGTWPITFDLFTAMRAWQQEYPGQRTPLPAFMAVVTLLMWVIASLGIVVEIAFQLLPWSLGWIGGVDPELERTLFWFTGHPIVYFWLLPAYISWYTILPRQAGGKLFSDTMARISFLFFLAYSIPVGVHHQFEDPGIGQTVKLVQAFFTFIVFFPSLLTAFALAASLESVGWARGDRFWFSWLRRVPWGDPSVAAQLLAMLLFIFGGIGGLINASYNLDLLIHNTAFIVGHFHITVGSATALTFTGAAYWLVPHLAGRPLWSRRAAQAQVWLWFVGMALFSATEHFLGILGMPRRTDIATATYIPATWHIWFPLVALGGGLMGLSGLLFLLNMAMTAFHGARREQEAPAFADALHGPKLTPRLFDRLGPWLVVTIALIVIAYGPVAYDFITLPGIAVPGIRAW